MEAIYVSGMGVITSIGSGNEQFWEALLAGRSGVKEITRFDTSWLPIHTAAVIEETNPLNNLFPEELTQLESATQVMISAARSALENAGLLNESGRSADPGIPLFLSTTHGELHTHYQDYIEIIKKNDRAEILEYTKKYLHHNIVYSLLMDTAKYLGLEGFQSLNTNACASSGYSISLGMEHIRQGHSQRALCGGVDITSITEFAGFCSLRTLSPDICRPFDLNRPGLVLGDGSGVILLESASSLRARGGRPIARLAGYGWSNDAYHLSGPHPEGIGIKQALNSAMRDARIKPEEIDFIIAHGTGTPGNDQVEAHAFRDVFQPNTPIVTAPKSMIGHTLGAASVIEAIVGILSLRHQQITPTINYQTPDPDCPVPIAANQPVAKDLQVCLTNSSGFGGNNNSMIFTLPDYGANND